MSVTSAEGAEFARELGCSRVVLGRELSLADIRRIREATDMELEVFCHGALCVSYSGQCFSSEAWGGRSANRGQCAQACRLSYELVVDGALYETGSSRYLLSPGDLFAIEQVPTLVEIGVACLKIEGRYKDENYVAATTRAYREAIDAAIHRRIPAHPAKQRQMLEQLYSRGLGPWFLQGTDHQRVVEGRAPRHRGLLAGTVDAVGGDGAVDVSAVLDLRAGDGVVFDAADWRSPDEPEEGGNIFSAEALPGPRSRIRLRFGNGAIDFQRIRPGDRLWRTGDPQLLVQLKPLARRKPRSGPLYTRPLHLHVSGRPHQPLHVIASTDDGISVSASSRENLAIAEHQGLSEEKTRQQLGRLGGTPFHPGRLSLDIGDMPLFLPLSQLNDLRRELVEKLIVKRKIVVKTRTGSGLTPHVERWLSDHPLRPVATEKAGSARLHVLVRSAEQLAAAMECRPESITLDYLELYGLRPSVERIREAGIVARVASPRILKPAEQKVVRFLTSLECAIVVRSAGLLHDLLQIPEVRRPALIGDFSLNVANAVAASGFLTAGLQSLTPTWDLNARQIFELARRIDAARIEVIAYGHLPVFHTEHCVFCRFLSKGTDNTNCGHPCESHQLSLRDQQGRLHPVIADVGCRNTVFGEQAQVTPQWMSRWREAGLSNFRIEFVQESPRQVSGVIDAFRSLLDDRLSPREFHNQLNGLAPAGTTQGSFFVPP
jgi:putative protease